MNNNGDSRSYEVAAVRKALEILCEFSPATPSLAVSELSRRLEFPKSTAHNLLRTLQSMSFVEQDPEDKRYRLGPKVFELGLLFPHNMQLVAQARPYLRRLADQTKETVKLAILSNGEGLILAALESPFQLHTRGDEGRRAPLHCTGIGKAILASIDDEEIREIVASRGLPRFTPRTVTSLVRLEEQIRQIRTEGYTLDWEENEEGVRCAAAPVTNFRVAAAISISGPSSRIPEKRMFELAELVRDTARTVSTTLRERSWREA